MRNVAFLGTFQLTSWPCRLLTLICKSTLEESGLGVNINVATPSVSDWVESESSPSTYKATLNEDERGLESKSSNSNSTSTIPGFEGSKYSASQVDSAPFMNDRCQSTTSTSCSIPIDQPAPSLI